MPSRLRVYKVWYSRHSSMKVRAFTREGAKRQAWEALRGYKYGWTRKDFMKNASVELIS